MFAIIQTRYVFDKIVDGKPEGQKEVIEVLGDLYEEEGLAEAFAQDLTDWPEHYGQPHHLFPAEGEYRERSYRAVPMVAPW